MTLQRFAMKGPAVKITLTGMILESDVEKLQLALRAAKDESVLLYLNSGGGDSWAGSAMAALVEEHGGVSAIGIGLVASAATSVFCACRPAVLHAECPFMIHDPSSVVVGTPAQLRKAADDVDTISDVYARSLARRTGQPVARIRQWMVAETWLSPEEAVALGFADEVIGGAAEEPAAADYTRFQHAPERLVRLAKERGWAKAPEKAKGEADA